MPNAARSGVTTGGRRALSSCLAPIVMGLVGVVIGWSFAEVSAGRLSIADLRSQGASELMQLLSAYDGEELPPLSDLYAACAAGGGDAYPDVSFEPVRAMPAGVFPLAVGPTSVEEAVRGPEYSIFRFSHGPGTRECTLLFVRYGDVFACMHQSDVPDFRSAWAYIDTATFDDFVSCAKDAALAGNFGWWSATDP
jgi:hypothetical protein